MNSETNDIQTWSEYDIQLLNKLFVNGVTLREQNLSQRAEANLNKISNNINKTHTGLISVLQ